jgi:hypothetical protein
MEISVRRVARRADEELSLELSNEVWPQHAVTMNEVDSFKCAQIIWARHQGYQRLVTSNELRNEPIRRLNAGLGYRETPRRVLMRGPLARER